MNIIIIRSTFSLDDVRYRKTSISKGLIVLEVYKFDTEEENGDATIVYKQSCETQTDEGVVMPPWGRNTTILMVMGNHSEDIKMCTVWCSIEDVLDALYKINRMHVSLALYGFTLHGFVLYGFTLHKCL